MALQLVYSSTQHFLTSHCPTIQTVASSKQTASRHKCLLWQSIWLFLYYLCESNLRKITSHVSLFVPNMTYNFLHRSIKHKHFSYFNVFTAPFDDICRNYKRTSLKFIFGLYQACRGSSKLQLNELLTFCLKPSDYSIQTFLLQYLKQKVKMRNYRVQQAFLISHINSDATQEF